MLLDIVKQLYIFLIWTFNLGVLMILSLNHNQSDVCFYIVIIYYTYFI